MKTTAAFDRAVSQTERKRSRAPWWFIKILWIDWYCTLLTFENSTLQIQWSVIRMLSFHFILYSFNFRFYIVWLLSYTFCEDRLLAMVIDYFVENPTYQHKEEGSKIHTSNRREQRSDVWKYVCTTQPHVDLHMKFFQHPHDFLAVLLLLIGNSLGRRCMIDTPCSNVWTNCFLLGRRKTRQEKKIGVVATATAFFVVRGLWCWERYLIKTHWIVVWKYVSPTTWMWIKKANMMIPCHVISFYSRTLRFSNRVQEPIQKNIV